MDSSGQKEHSNTFLNVLDPKSLQSDSFGENVLLSNDSEVQSKKSHKVLYFSDGTLEYNTDDEEVEETNQNDNRVDPKTLTWGPWMWHYLFSAGMKTLGACDYLGEGLANFFGITTPKYQYEIEEFYRMKAEEEEIKRNEDLEMGGWTQKQTEGSEHIVHTSVNEHAASSQISLQQGTQDCSSEVNRERNNQKRSTNEDATCEEEVKLLQ